MIRGPETNQLIEKLSDAGVLEFEAIGWLERVIAEQTALPTHSCSCHARSQGPCGVCIALGCEVWNFNQMGLPPFGERPSKEDARQEFDRLIKLPRFNRVQSERLRHLKWHINRGDVMCDCQHGTDDDRPFEKEIGGY